MLIKGKNLTGIVLVILLSFVVLYTHYHEVFHNPSEISFASRGDGLKSNFGTIYHIKYDSTYWRTSYMNYPYGESVFYTGNQVLATNFLKLLYDSGWDLSEQAMGILNIWLLLSFVIGSALLFLIFRQIALPVWLAIVGALILTFLSPHWNRLTGHYNLAYAWVFPLTIWLLLRFMKTKRFYLSVIIGVYLLIISAKHPYFYIISGFLIFVVLTYLFIWDSKSYGGRYRILWHFVFQLVLPAFIFSVFTSQFDLNSDRTSYPWGFFFTTTRIEGIFLPLGLPHGEFIKISGSWKTLSYVGLTGAIMFLVINSMVLWKLYSGKGGGSLKITGHYHLNILYFASIFCFLISLGIPFTLGFDTLLNYTGPFRQFRAVGRFVFPFFYVFGIVSIVYLWNWQKKHKSLLVKILFALALIIYGYESWVNVETRSQSRINRFMVLNDWNNVLPVNEWVNKYNWQSFQAVLPLPYFHIGSENFWVGNGSPNQTDAYFVSLKTGLPLYATTLSRTSISETLKSISIKYEPVSEYEIMADLESDKPFLLMVYKNAWLNEMEKRIIRYADFMEENEIFKLYRFYPASLYRLHKDYLDELNQRANKIIQNNSKGECLVYEDYSEKEDSRLLLELSKESTIHELSFPDTGIYYYSFWVNGMNKDLWPRSRIYENYCDTEHNCSDLSYNISEKIVALDGAWGLYENNILIKNAGQVIKFTIHNQYLTRGVISIDNFLIRKEGEDVLTINNGNIFFNNRPVAGNFASD